MIERDRYLPGERFECNGTGSRIIHVRGRNRVVGILVFSNPKISLASRCWLALEFSDGCLRGRATLGRPAFFHIRYSSQGQPANPRTGVRVKSVWLNIQIFHTSGPSQVIHSYYYLDCNRYQVAVIRGIMLSSPCIMLREHVLHGLEQLRDHGLVRVHGHRDFHLKLRLLF